MAKVQDIVGDDAFLQGTDFTYPCEILNGAETAAIDITGWALSWLVKRYKADADVAALITKTTSSGIAIAGSYNATPASNTQRATITVEDTDTTSLSPGLYYHELKRTTSGSETVLITGLFELADTVHR